MERNGGHHIFAGGGLSISGTSVATVTHTLFWDNDAWEGSGLFFQGIWPGSPLALLGNAFVDNGQGASGIGYGGYASAVQAEYARVYAEGNIFRGGYAGNDWGAVGIFNSQLLFVRNVVYANESYRTAGLYLSGVSPFTVTNNIIAGNRSTSLWENAAVQIVGGSGVFLHNTIARNAGAYGLLVWGNATVALTNTILVSHTVGISVGGWAARPRCRGRSGAVAPGPTPPTGPVQGRSLLGWSISGAARPS